MHSHTHAHKHVFVQIFIIHSFIHIQVDAFINGRAKPYSVVGCDDLAAFIASLRKPRKIMLMVKVRVGGAGVGTWLGVGRGWYGTGDLALMCAVADDDADGGCGALPGHHSVCLVINPWHSTASCVLCALVAHSSFSPWTSPPCPGLDHRNHLASSLKHPLSSIHPPFAPLLSHFLSSPPPRPTPIPTLALTLTLRPGRQWMRLWPSSCRYSPPGTL